VSNASPNPYTDNLAVNSYYYWVTAVSAGGESAVKAPDVGNPVAVVACGSADLITSNKDIMAINGVAISPVPDASNSVTDPLPTSTNLKKGDKLSFRITLRNTGNSAASSTKVSDVLTNLQMPTAGWNAKYDGSPLTYDTSCSGTSYPTTSDHYCVYGSAPNQTLLFNLSADPDNISSSPGARTLTFDAQLAVPSTYIGATARFQNGFTITYNKSTGVAATPVTGFTPLLIFYTGVGVPSIIEVP
jgi:hypothetical protein